MCASAVLRYIRIDQVESDWLKLGSRFFTWKTEKGENPHRETHNTKNTGLFTYQYFAYSHRLESNQVVWHTIMYLLIGPEVSV